MIVVEDGLASNAPPIRHLQALDLRFILGAKQGDHTFLFDWVERTAQTAETTLTDQQGFRHRFRYLNGAPLNEANFDLEVNFLEYWEHAPDGTVTHFAWVTDIPIEPNNLMTLMRGARARWKIENETFNTLKNQGDHFEHNFGHGHQHLSTVLVPVDHAAGERELLRELRHTLERACILGEGTRLALDLELVDEPATDLTRQGVTEGGLKSRTQAEERALILAALNHHHYHMTATAAALGISRKTLWQKMKRYGLPGMGTQT